VSEFLFMLMSIFNERYCNNYVQCNSISLLTTPELKERKAKDMQALYVVQMQMQMLNNANAYK
jgi:hypothetical protein